MLCIFSEKKQKMKIFLMAYIPFIIIIIIIIITIRNINIKK